MECKFNQDLLQQYVDGSIGELERIFAQEHLKVCSRCQKTVRELVWLAEALALGCPEPPGIEAELESLVRHTASQVSPECSRIGVSELLRQQKSVASCAAQFLQHIPGAKYLASASRKGLEMAPKAMWGVSRGLFVGGAKLVKVWV